MVPVPRPAAAMAFPTWSGTGWARNMWWRAIRHRFQMRHLTLKAALRGAARPATSSIRRRSTNRVHILLVPWCLRQRLPVWSRCRGIWRPKRWNRFFKKFYIQYSLSLSSLRFLFHVHHVQSGDVGALARQGQWRCPFCEGMWGPGRRFSPAPPGSSSTALTSPCRQTQAASRIAHSSRFRRHMRRSVSRFSPRQNAQDIAKNAPAKNVNFLLHFWMFTFFLFKIEIKFLLHKILKKLKCATFCVSRALRKIQRSMRERGSKCATFAQNHNIWTHWMMRVHMDDAQTLAPTPRRFGPWSLTAGARRAGRLLAGRRRFW